MNKIMVALVVVLILGCLGGLFVLKKYLSATQQISSLNRELRKSIETVGELTELLGSQSLTKMVFLHHSVGRNILYAGGLQSRLLEQGIFVSGATYGDEIGQHTDIPDWLPKFQKEMEKILTFKSHPDQYHSDGTRNEIVMFKSCFPNSNIVDESAAEVDSGAFPKTLAIFQATFTSLKREMMSRGDTLFVYLTAPPLVLEKTTPENAARARLFNDWLINEYLVDYRSESERDNFAIFDLFGFLAGPDNLLKEAYRIDKPSNAHPNDDASQLAAEAFVEFFTPLWEEWQRRKVAGAV